MTEINELFRLPKLPDETYEEQMTRIRESASEPGSGLPRTETPKEQLERIRRESRK